MAWNRSAERTPDAPKVRSKSRLVLLSVVAFTAVILLAILFFFSKKVTGSREAEIQKKQIAEQTPTLKVKADAAAESNRTSTTDRRHIGPTNKVELTKNVKPPTVLGCNYYECVSGGRPLFAKPVFTNSAENIIGGLLAARPGERFVDVDLGQDFDDDFVASLEFPIEIFDDDDHDTATLKAAVIKAKEQIALGMKSGQRPSAFITSMRDEMNKIADYRDLLQADFDRIKETGTAHQIEAYLKEANQLLDEFGAMHLDLPEDEIEEINRRLETNPDGEKESTESTE